MLSLLLLPVLLADPRAGFAWPLAGSPVVERRFDPPATDYGAGHRGVDLAADRGDEVLAAGPGTVTYAGVLAGRGVVAVTHAGGLRTTYEPVDATVAQGDVVVTGDVLGTVGTGHASCPRVTCLHWGLRRGDAYLDPLALVLGGPVRLLPVGGATPWAAPQAAARAAPHASVTPRAGAPGTDRGASSDVPTGVGLAAAGLAGAGLRRLRSG